jgi:fucose permease
MALHAAAGLGYFLGPLLLGYWILKYQSFQATFMTGLAIFATGSLAFWPSSILRSYPGFFISNFIIFFGLAVLELAADTFVALAGPGELSEARLNFAQAFNGIGSIVSPIIAQEALFSGINEEDLFRVQWCYFATALFVVLLAVVFYYVPLSEASDDELEAMALRRLYNAGLERGVKVFGVSARLLLLWSGVAMMWLYIGCQDTVAYFWSPLVQFAKPGFGSFWSLSVARSVFTASRFLTAGLCYVGVPPRITLGVCFLGACVTSIVALVLPPGGAGLAMLLLYYFFEGPMVPTLYAMVLRGQGRHTKFAASAIVSSISGSAVWPAIVYGIENLHPTSGRPPLLVVAILFGISTLWPIMLSSRRVLRRWVDPKWSKRRVNGPGEGTQLAFESLHEKGAPVVAHHERVGTEAHP